MSQAIAPGSFANSQAVLDAQAPRVIQERRKLGLEGLVGGLTAIIINTEAANQRAAVDELVGHTGLELEAAYEGPSFITCVLTRPGSADVLVRSRRRADGTVPADPAVNPFAAFNDRPRTRQLTNTRLETLVFQTPDLRRYFEIQKSRGKAFLTPEPVITDKYLFIQTTPSPYTGTSVGLVQWLGRPGDRHCSDLARLDWSAPAHAGPYAANVRHLDHVAVRVTAEDRDAAILELMELTNYNFAEAYYVEGLNSITNVTRGSRLDPAIVVTSGISPYVDEESSGPTEKFVHLWGPRTHHVAFWTEYIDETFGALKAGGMEFLIDLVGSPQEGLKQTFTQPSPNTLLVYEYIYRYGHFDGFFTKSNITALTRATGKQ